jgi:hypothetical protein
MLTHLCEVKCHRHKLQNRHYALRELRLEAGLDVGNGRVQCPDL